MYKVDNAVIMAAGTSSRFAPLSYERPKALTEVKGELLIERQIRQLREAGIDEIYIVTGYKAEQFNYLKEKFGVELIHNPDYLTRNNNSSIWQARHVIRNTYICSADNYFSENPFEKEVEGAYYAAVYSNGPTNEWCMTEKDGLIDSVTVGGHDAWYMLGHVFWDEKFSEKFLNILAEIYDEPETADKLWENIFIDHIEELPMRIRKYPEDEIFEFDTLDEMRQFDRSYIDDTRSVIIKKICQKLSVREADIVAIRSFKDKDESAAGFTFTTGGKNYKYSYKNEHLEEV
jgi:CTP:phosphocholine cytidylyltransferase-like protein